MTPVTQILLLLSYAILGIAVMIIPPRLFGMGSEIASFLAMLIFFGAWQIQNWLIGGRAAADAKKRIEHLEDVSHILRKDLERTRREVENRGRAGEEKNDLLVSELKVLQTLLSQVNKKELELKGEAVPEQLPQPTEEEVLELSVSHEQAQTTTDIETTNIKDDDIVTSADLDELELTPDEAALVVMEPEKAAEENSLSDTGPTATSGKISSERKPERKRKGKAAIRIIKREDQLLSVVRNSLSENRVDLYLQPIVGLPSRRIMHYECFSRVRDEEGRIILPRQYVKVAESKGLIGTIDNLLLFRLIQLVRRLGKRRPDLKFFCNMSRYSMMDEEFFPQFIDFMTSNEEFANRLVFEISQADYMTLDEEVLENLQALGRKGFGFSMDMVADFEQDFSSLEQHYFQFIKSDVRDLMASHTENSDIGDYKAYLRRKGMQLIACRIESEEKVLQTLDAQVELAQGYLFGEPAAASELNREL